MVSLYRTFNNIRRGGIKEFYRNLKYVWAYLFAMTGNWARG